MLIKIFFNGGLLSIITNTNSAGFVRWQIQHRFSSPRT